MLLLFFVLFLKIHLPFVVNVFCFEINLPSFVPSNPFFFCRKTCRFQTKNNQAATDSGYTYSFTQQPRSGHVGTYPNTACFNEIVNCDITCVNQITVTLRVSTRLSIVTLHISTRLSIVTNPFPRDSQVSHVVHNYFCHSQIVNCHNHCMFLPDCQVLQTLQVFARVSIVTNTTRVSEIASCHK